MTNDNPGTEPGTWCLFSNHYPRSFGGGPVDFVAKLMNVEGWHPTGLAELSIIFVQCGDYLPHQLTDGSIVTDGSHGQSARWEAYLAGLPSRRFERKKSRLSIVLRGDPALDFSDRQYLKVLTLADFKVATAMVQQALAFAQSGLKRSDGIDLGSLIAAANQLAARDWGSDENLRAELELAYQVHSARIDAMDPWRILDLTGAHPQARSILDQPDDWTAANSFSPHGSDLGADILADWPNLRRKSVEAVASHFDIDLSSQSWEGSLDRIQLMLAIAFAHVKRTGTCPSDLAARTVALLEADKAQAIHLIAAEYHADWARHCRRYESILNRFCNP